MAVLLAVSVSGPASTALFAETPEAATPLERLRQRSADDRWRTLRDRYAAEPQAEAPAVAGEVEERQTANSPQTRQVGGREFGSWQKSGRTPTPFEPQATSTSAPVDPFGPAVVPSASDRPTPVSAPLELPALGNGTEPAPLRFSQGDPAPQPAPQTAPGADVPLEPVPDNQDPDAGPFAGEASRFVKLKPISSIQPFLDYSPDGSDPCENLCPRPDGAPCKDDGNYKQCPEVFALPESGSPDRYFAESHFFWAATNLRHNPLYFEDPTLERYGHVFVCEAVQPFVSVGKFGAQLAGLPYQMVLHPPCSEEYVLGWYRPGDWAPKKIYQVPLNAKAAAATAATYTGLIFLFP